MVVSRAPQVALAAAFFLAVMGPALTFPEAEAQLLVPPCPAGQLPNAQNVCMPHPPLPHCSDPIVPSEARSPCGLILNPPTCEGGIFPQLCAIHGLLAQLGCDVRDLNDVYDCLPSLQPPPECDALPGEAEACLDALCDALEVGEDCTPSVIEPDCQALPMDPRCNPLVRCLTDGVAPEGLACLPETIPPECNLGADGTPALCRQFLCDEGIAAACPPPCEPGETEAAGLCVPMPGVVPECPAEADDTLNETLCTVLQPCTDPEGAVAAVCDFTECDGLLDSGLVNCVIELVCSLPIVGGLCPVGLPPECTPGHTDFNVTECAGPTPGGLPDCDRPQGQPNATLCAILNPCRNPMGPVADVCDFTECEGLVGDHLLDCLMGLVCSLPGVATLCPIAPPPLCVEGANVTPCLPECPAEADDTLNETLCAALDPQLGDGFVAHIQTPGLTGADAAILLDGAAKNFTVTVYVGDGDGFAAASSGSYNLVVQVDCDGLKDLVDEVLNATENCAGGNDTTTLTRTHGFTAAATGTTVAFTHAELASLLRPEIPATAIHIFVEHGDPYEQSNYAVPTALMLAAGGAEAAPAVDLVDAFLWHPVLLVGEPGGPDCEAMPSDPQCPADCDENPEDPRCAAERCPPGTVGTPPVNCQLPPPQCEGNETAVGPQCVENCPAGGSTACVPGECQPPLLSTVCDPPVSGTGDGFVALILPQRALRTPDLAVVEKDSRGDYAFDVCAFDDEGEPVAFTGWRFNLTGEAQLTVGSLPGDDVAAPANNGDNCVLVRVPGSVRGAMPANQFYLAAFEVPDGGSLLSASYSETVNALLADGQAAQADIADDATPTPIHFVLRNGSPGGTGDFSLAALLDNPAGFLGRAAMHLVGMLT